MRTFTYLPLLILWSAGLTASAGIAQEFPTINAPGMRPCRQMTWSLLVDIPHFSAVCLIDKYSIQHLIFGILFLGIKRRLYYRCNCEQSQFQIVGLSRQFGLFTYFSHFFCFKLVCEQCPDGPFLLVGDSQALSIIAMRWLRVPAERWIHRDFIWKFGGDLV